MRLPDTLKKLLFFFLVNLLVHLPFLNLPPCGQHVWRQCNTLGMSRNFADEDMNIFKPRIDRRNATDGITGSHFPLYEWGLAAISRLTGFSDIVARIYSLVIFTFGMLFFYLVLLKLKFEPFVSSCGAILLLSIPQLYYDSINAMPDTLALSLSLGALYGFLGYFMEGRIKYILLAVPLTIAAGLIKFQFLIIPFASMAYMRYNKNQIIISLLSAILVVIPVTAWYRYALSLTQLNNLREFGLWIQPISTERKWNTLLSNVVSDLPELLTGWPLFAALVIGLVMFVRSFRLGRENIFMLLWLFGFTVFYFLAIERMKHHSYYFMALLPLFIIVVLRFFVSYSGIRLVLVSLVALNLAWAFLRIAPDRWLHGPGGIPKEFADKNMLKELQDCIPPNAKTVVGPDISGCIFFYFLNTEGYSFENPSELLEVKNDGVYFEVMKRNGVKYLVYERQGDFSPVFKELSGLKLKKQVGNFSVFEME